jgi:hypothetical protein
VTSDIAAKESSPHAATVSKGSLWIGCILSALSILFLLMDGVMKLIKPPPIVETTVRLGYPESVIQSLGIVLLVCTILYAIPRTSILGAILLICSDELIRLACDSRASAKPLSRFGIFPAFPKAAKGERASVFHGDERSLLRLRIED